MEHAGVLVSFVAVGAAIDAAVNRRGVAARRPRVGVAAVVIVVVVVVFVVVVDASERTRSRDGIVFVGGIVETSVAVVAVFCLELTLVVDLESQLGLICKKNVCINE